MKALLSFSTPARCKTPRRNSSCLVAAFVYLSDFTRSSLREYPDTKKCRFGSLIAFRELASGLITREPSNEVGYDSHPGSSYIR